ncbi:MAG TPA: TRIC cation channel family protein [Trebonia sp.]
MRTTDLILILDLLGVFANGLLGGAVARSLDLDLFGFAAIGLISGLGGGIIRDVLLEHGPPAALTNAAYIPTALAGAGVAFLVQIEHKTWDRVFIGIDAAALSLWATAGALKTLHDGFGWLPAVLLGTVTAVGGAIIRDLMIQRVPSVFTQGTLYATVAIVVAAIQVIFVEAFGLSSGTGTAVAITVGVVLRLVAYWRGWQLPRGLQWKIGPRRAE